jgi:tetratricopeptide (TPR) repeat protein
MKKFVITLVVVPALSLAWSASAEQGGPTDTTEEEQQQQEFDALVTEAVQHYSARRYEQAIDLFEQAFAIQGEPELVYNIARSHERLANRDQALEWYERFINMPGTTGELRTRALSNIASLRQEIAALRAAEQAGVAPDGGTGLVTNNERTETGTGTGRPPSGPVEPPAPEPRPFRTAGYSLIGVGAVAMIAGGIFGGMALAAHSEFEDASEIYSQERVDLRDDVELRSLMSDILLFSGAGIAAAGIVLVVLDAIRARRASEEDEGADEVSLVPSLTLANGGYGFGLVGRF